jgi:hypothetical protein
VITPPGTGGTPGDFNISVPPEAIGIAIAVIAVAAIIGVGWAMMSRGEG